MAKCNRPFVTIAAANAAAVAGDTVHVWPGLYLEQLVLKDGVQYYFEDGAVVRWNGAGSTITALTQVTSSIDGAGVFESDPAGIGDGVLTMGTPALSPQPVLFVRAKAFVEQLPGGIGVAVLAYGGILLLDAPIVAINIGIEAHTGNLAVPNSPTVYHYGPVTYNLGAIGGIGLWIGDLTLIEQFGDVLDASPAGDGASGIATTGGNPSITVYGNVTGDVDTIFSVDATTLRVFGDVTALTGPAVTIGAANDTQITGDVSAPGTGGFGTVEMVNTARLIVTGNVSVGAGGVNARAIHAIGANRVKVYGDVTAVDDAAIELQNTSTAEVYGKIQSGSAVANKATILVGTNSRILVYGDVVDLSGAAGAGACQVTDSAVAVVHGNLLSNGSGGGLVVSLTAVAEVYGDVEGLFSFGGVVRVFGNVREPNGFAQTPVALAGPGVGDVTIYGDVTGQTMPAITVSTGSVKVNGNVTSQAQCIVTTGAAQLVRVKGNVATTQPLALTIDAGFGLVEVDGEVSGVDPATLVVQLTAGEVRLSGRVVRATAPAPVTGPMIQSITGTLRLSNLYVNEQVDAGGIEIVSALAASLVYCRDVTIVGQAVAGDSIGPLGGSQFVFATDGGSNLAPQLGTVVVGTFFVNLAIL